MNGPGPSQANHSALSTGETDQRTVYVRADQALPYGTGQVVATNPAHAVRGPKHVVKTGKTTVLEADQARTLLAKGKRWWVPRHEKGGKRHEMPAHHNLEVYLDAYIASAHQYAQE